MSEHCDHVLKLVSSEGDFKCEKCKAEFCATPCGLQPKVDNNRGRDE
jgi:hypothetical protein